MHDLGWSKFLQMILLFGPLLFPSKGSFWSDAKVKRKQVICIFTFSLSHTPTKYLLSFYNGVAGRCSLHPASVRNDVKWLSCEYQEFCYSTNKGCVLALAALLLSHSPQSEFAGSEIQSSAGVSLREGIFTNLPQA